MKLLKIFSCVVLSIALWHSPAHSAAQDIGKVYRGHLTTYEQINKLGNSSLELRRGLHEIIVMLHEQKLDTRGSFERLSVLYRRSLNKYSENPTATDYQALLLIHGLIKVTADELG